ncbi:MAG TPA: DUF92 domain-containing protein [Thermoanaerobaculia bacterium]|nr:DUF92 domain-containing protein [Thermoanaerobaculia bacterium]
MDGVAEPGREARRKVVHIAFGFCALLLKWLIWYQAAALALAALLFNRFALPHLGGRSISRGSSGYDAGILLYPLAVLVLLLAFPDRPEIAGAVWAILAFGDGSATLAGLWLPGAPLPWNKEKSWGGLAAFLLIGFATACPIWFFLSSRSTVLSGVTIVAITVAVCGIVESLADAIDDNISIPLTGAFTMVLLTSVEQIPALAFGDSEVVWLVLNTVLALAGYAARSVDLSGLAGGWILGAILIVFAGWELYVVLLLFFVIGTVATRLGYERKQRLGLAQERGGRRGFGHAFSNAGIAAIAAIGIAMSPSIADLYWIAAIAALATATADTTGSEIGQWIGRRAFLPITFEKVEPGTEGAVSWEGTAAGLVTAMFVAAAGVALFLNRTGEETTGSGALFAIVASAAFLASYSESVLGSWNRRRATPIPNGVMNFINTAAGAMLAVILVRLVECEL